MTTRRTLATAVLTVVASAFLVLSWSVPPSAAAPTPRQTVDSSVAPAPPVDDEPGSSDEGSLIDQVDGDIPVTADGPGTTRVRLSAFDMYYEVDVDTGGIPVDAFDDTRRAAADAGGERLNGWLLDNAWGLLTWLVKLVCWLVKFGLSFGLADALVHPVNALTGEWKRSVIDRIHAEGFFMLVGAAWVAITLLTGKYRQGLLRLVTTSAIAGFAAFLLVDPGSRLLGPEGLLGHTRQVSADVAAITAPTVPHDAAPDAVGEAVSTSLIRSLVVKPHQVLNYGTILAPGTCTARYWQVITDRQAGRGDEAKEGDDWLLEHCTQGGFDRAPTVDRVIAVDIMLLGGLVVLALAGVIVVAVLTAQAAAAGWACFTLVAFTAGVAWPQLMRVWLTGLISAVAMVVVPVVILTAYVSLADAVLAADSGISILGRFAILDCLALAAFVLRKRVARGARRFARRSAEAATDHAYGLVTPCPRCGRTDCANACRPRRVAVGEQRTGPERLTDHAQSRARRVVANRARAARYAVRRSRASLRPVTSTPRRTRAR